MIFGRDLLRANNAIIDYKNGIVTFHDLVATTILTNRDKNGYAKVAQTVLIPAQSECSIPVTCHKKYYKKDILLEPISGAQWHNYALGRSLNHTQNGKMACLILNHQHEGILLRKGQKIATINLINVARDCIPFSRPPDAENDTESESKNTPDLTDAKLQEFCDDYKFNLNPELMASQKWQLLLVLYKYRKAFARNMSELGRYKKFQLDSEVLNHTPKYQRPYPLKQHEKVEALRQIEEMKKFDLIQPAEDHLHNIPLFMIAKREPAGAAGQGPQTSKQGDSFSNNVLGQRSYRLLADLRSTNAAITIIPASMERI
jgi:hypothetical protein